MASAKHTMRCPWCDLKGRETIISATANGQTETTAQAVAERMVWKKFSSHVKGQHPEATS